MFSTALVPPGAELVAVQNTTHAFKGPEVTNGDGFTALSSSLNVSANTTGSVTYTYIQPNVVSASGITHHYDLYIQKQAGIDQLRPQCQRPTADRCDDDPHGKRWLEPGVYRRRARERRVYVGG